ncbi:predicted protein [Sclerotinia sclerotiorum 1980 UF-70]|uniref:Uncharacterized protein n=1 Tax=Sclerotinia sclerotiorum (strain ATCC 18683 / 1980 / Ss-1) TaxID=665079 RepID=A7EPX9_SCLS1|nr:predicted protein [Sclerotinia sclerotiorum 1980 UF-70]EDO04895.1 predicted protein [Sclerotinia sclerotiorum 1980 UF-70]
MVCTASNISWQKEDYLRSKMFLENLHIVETNVCCILLYYLATPWMQILISKPIR